MAANSPVGSRGSCSWNQLRQTRLAPARMLALSTRSSLKSRCPPSFVEAFMQSVQCCVLGWTYSPAVNVFNHGLVPAKASLSLPAWSETHLKCSGKIGFCQVCLRISPRLPQSKGQALHVHSGNGRLLLVQPKISLRMGKPRSGRHRLTRLIMHEQGHKHTLLEQLPSAALQ